VLSPSEVVPALTDVSFRVEKGETFGVVGANGCGKSTLLKLVAGIFRPTAGTLEVDGKVSALIELGAGFHPEISGRENAVINGVMLGLTRHEIERKLPAIIEFSGLSEFIDQPVKTYSSGMYVRLGFAVAIHVDPAILVVDEVLAVGDEAFAHRCLDTIREFSAKGRTILFVTHALSLVEEMCDRVLYLDHGRAKLTGEPREVLAAYRLDVSAGEGERLAGVHAKDQQALRDLPESAGPGEFRGVLEAGPGAGPQEAKKGQEVPLPQEEAPRQGSADGARPSTSEEERPRRWGDRSAEITGCRLLDASGAERYAFRTGESVTVEIDVVPRRPLDDFVFGIGLFTPEDHCVHGTNTDVDGLVAGMLDAPATVRVTLPRCDLGAGTYLLDVAVHARRGTPYDYWRGACRFHVDSPDADAGVYRPERRWTSSGGLRWRAS
jgi:ABC-type polysaccharide/polyol phosphate transport system ATPase subunit